MLRNTSRQAINNIRNGIINAYNGSASGFNEICIDIIKTMQKETHYRRYKNVFEYLENWILSKPLLLDISGNASDTLADWLEQSEAEQLKYSETTAKEILLHLVAREIVKGAKATV